jgi:hypothetical protein
MLSTPCGVDFANTLLYHLKVLQLYFFPFSLSFPTLSEACNTKFLKRQMFGRAHLDLLRVKVLHAV